jgi:polyisoprenoid-binding protein YceI
MKKLITLLAFIATQTIVLAQTTWKNDKMHSHLQFTITHLAVSDVDGVFKDFEVTITTTKPDFSDAVFKLTANTASVNTGEEKRDGHLKSPDFFDVATYPFITFTSTAINKVSNSKYKLTGKFTMHGITKTITMDLWYRGTVVNPMIKTNDAGFQLTGVLKRSDFNLGSKFGPPMLSDEVQIKAAGEFGEAK